ncbi:endonuclease/exonuclease/phosphatase family protein [Shewanella rhizosphaerae]|uniref:endonuclease/exonuclease/phosphatase family protein n=1 Tax=Shewanella rhizosphaerae TaxID=2864207 RepID=UPI001C655F0C|nr:endonuclease/exonuclease/phosphatase family protein [Shewanella rhizosphaerae]QYK13606.1 endonuclease/exonuclease/phosphatase family protein [Shewanella rhizosphaerae]
MTQTSAAAGQIRIASFNLYNFIAPPDAYYDFNNIYTQAQWQQKCDWIRRYLASHDPCVIGFQEVFSIEALQALLAEAGYPYFVTVDRPEVSDDFIYRHPVLALASKYPILSYEPCDIDQTVASLMGIAPGFQYSRLPLRATIALPHLGPCDCYVVHFKSKRAQFEPEIAVTPDSGSEPAATGAQSDGLTIEKRGALFAIEAAAKWASSLIRGSEASLLRVAIARRRIDTRYPVILMGDFNDSLAGGVLSALVSEDSRLLGSLGEEAFHDYRLQDAYLLHERSEYSPTSVARAPTHYHLNRGEVIDYILLSNEFDPHNHQCLAQVSQYHTYDSHLINPQYDRDSHSTDHAPVMVSLKIRE